MGKESKERSRNQRNTAPYNVANSSFAKRLTSKVAEYIPSNWVSSWFDNTDAHEIDTSVPNNINSTRVQVEINNIESVSPNIKRSSISNHNNSVSNRSVYSSSKSQELGNETCSPILCSDKVPGPSGFNQQSQPTHKLFVASTPAFNPSKQLHTGGDNHSESGESTSGCSSLVSQSNKMRSDIELGKAKTLFLNRLITTEELPKTNKIGPQFDSTQFHSSSPGLNRSRNMSLFYPGTIAYGGASTYRKSLGSNSSNITSPNVFKPSMKRVSLSNQSKGSPSTAAMPHMSAIAQNILKTINACTPVSRMSSLPTPEEANVSNSSLRGGGSSGVKRKLPQLQIPTVVDLFALKRSERLAALSNSRQQNQSSSSSSSSSDEEDAQAITYTAKKSLQQKIKRARHDKTSKTQEVQTETENPNCVKLPNAVLNVPSLPVINIPVTPKRTKDSSIDVELDISFSEPVNCKTLNLSTDSSVLSIENEAANTSSLNMNFVYTSDSSRAKPKPRASITLPPVDASPNKNSLLYFENKSSSTKESTLSEPSVQSTESTSASQWKCTVCMMKHNASEVICKTCGQPKTNQQLESISAPAKTTQVPDLKANQSTKINASTWNNTSVTLTNTSTSNSLSESFKPAANSWECSVCCVRNKVEDDKCVCCTNPKPNDKCSKPVPVSSAPVSTSLSTSTAAPPLVTSGFGDMFKKPSGTWECSVCMVPNKSDANKCVACETDKPGSKAEKPASNTTDKTLSGPKFPFATSPGALTFKFGLDKVESKTSGENKTESSTSESIKTSSAPSFTFGMAVVTSAQSTSVKPSAATFSFGMPKSDSSQLSSSSSSNSVAKVSEASSPVLSSSLVTNGKEEKPPVTSNLFTKSEPTAILSNTGGNLFASASSSLSNSKPSLPSINFTNTATTTVTDSKTTTSTTFSIFNGPSTKLGTKPEIQSAETVKELPKPSIFGSTLAFPQSSVTVPPLFGTQANSSESKELVNSFTPGSSESPAKKINFGMPAKEQVEQKVMPFLKPAVTTNIFGPKEPEKPKENIFTFGASSSINPPSMLNNDQGQNVNANQPPISAFPAKTDGFRMPCVESPNNNKLLSFGASSGIQQPSQAQPSTSAFNFSAPNFTFGSNTSAPSFNSITGQQTQQPTNNIFGKPATNAGESMFGAGATGTVFGPNSTGFAAPSQPTASPACFQFGATVNTNSFSLNAQNSAPANSGYVFNAPATTPNFKPTFNFSGGAAPTFSAAPQPVQGVANTAGRRFKKAVRRR